MSCIHNSEIGDKKLIGLKQKGVYCSIFSLGLRLKKLYLHQLMGRFLYITDSSNSSSIVFELVSLVLALKANELVFERVTQMAVELINNHLMSVQ